MIDFEHRRSLESAQELLAPWKNSPSEISKEALRDLGTFVLQRPGAEEELLGELCGWTDRPLEAFLSACWRSEQWEAVGLAARVVQRRGTTGLVYWIESVLGEPGGARWMVDVLGDVHDDESTRLLIHLLDHADNSVRYRAADSLAAHRSGLDVRAFVRHLAGPIVKALAHPDPHTLIRALHRIADPALEPSFGKDAGRRAERVLIQNVLHEKRGSVRGDAIAALGEIGSRAAVRCLVDMLSREEERFHRDVVIALRKIRPEKALIALLGLLQSRDPIIREEAASALGAIGDPQAVKRLRELLDDEDADVRQEAVLALGRLGGREVLLDLEKALEDPDPQVRTLACCALAESIGRKAQGKLIRALYDSAADVRSEAAFHLGNVGDANARAHLEGRLADKERDAFGETVASAARKSLWRLKRLGGGRR